MYSLIERHIARNYILYACIYVTVYTQGWNFWSHTNRLSMVQTSGYALSGVYLSHIWMWFSCKKEYDTTKASHGDVGSDMAVKWDVMHDIIIKRYKRNSCMRRVQSCWFWERTGPNTLSKGTSVCPHTRFARNTQLRGTMCFRLLFFHDHVLLINQALVFMTFICLAIHREDVPNVRRSEYHTARTTEPYWCWQRSVTTDQDVLNQSQSSDIYMCVLAYIHPCSSAYIHHPCIHT